MTGKIVATAVILTLLLSCAGGSAAQKSGSTAIAASTYKYDTEGVRLEGMLTERTFYGPPGFGETPAKDAKDKVLVLKLKTPINVEPAADAKAKGSESLDPFKNIREVQLFIPQNKRGEGQEATGKPVVVVGTLREGISPGQHTKVTMDVSTLTPK